jgi:hypothetical protein
MNNQYVMGVATAELPSRKPTGSAQKPKQKRQMHGLTSVVKAANGFDPKALDGRTTLAKELLQDRNELIAALGGSGEVSPQELAIIDMIAQKRARRRIAAQWVLLNRDKLFDRRKKKLAPIAIELEQMEESEVRLLKELGLKRRAKPVVSLGDMLAKAQQKRPKSAPASPPVNEPPAA